MLTIDDIQIFIATHNRANFLKESINSLLNQTITPNEIIVLDNESTDNTETIVKEFSDKGVKYIKTTGFLGNFKKAKELASKQYIMLFHDDDLLHPKYLEIALDILNKHENISIITTRYKEFQDTKVPKFVDNISSDFYEFENQAEFANFLYYQEFVAYATAIYKTEFFKLTDIEYDKFNKFNDWPFMVKIAGFGKSIILKCHDIFLVRRHSGQDTWTTTNTPSIQQIINWDLFFKEALKAGETYNNLLKFKKRYKHFLLGKYRSFLSEKDKLSITEKQLINYARQQGIEQYIGNEPILLKGNSMHLKNKLQIFLITYNRKKKLKDTLDAILDNKSPIRDFSITILDNASTDGTSEMIDDYCIKFNNLKHIRHNRNIGGNANICRAFEMGASCGKDYVWVLCDDDKYDFSNWHEVEQAIENRYDIICTADYILPKGKKNNKAYQIFQLTFVPAGIYKVKNITQDVLINMYDAIYTMFQQSCLTINIINNKGKVHVLNNPIVFNGWQYDDRCDDVSYTRGQNGKNILDRRKNTNWTLGFSNVITLLDDKNLQKECMEAAIPYKDIHATWNGFYNYMNDIYLTKNNINYFYEIFKSLPHKRKTELIKLIMNNHSKKIMQMIFSLRNSHDKSHKIITILGVKLKIRKTQKNKTPIQGGGGYFTPLNIGATLLLY